MKSLSEMNMEAQLTDGWVQSQRLVKNSEHVVQLADTDEIDILLVIEAASDMVDQALVDVRMLQKQPCTPA